MRYYREKSWLLGLLALIAPLPLPFNEVVGWPSVIAFCGAVALFLVRTNRGENWVLPYWVMNLLGLLYIPFLIGDLSMLRTGRVLPPLVHLALFAMAVKLFALRREQDKWHLLLGLFFLFIASMGTSVHPAAILYLIGFGSLASLILIRFAGLHTVSTISRSGTEPRVPVRRFLTGLGIRVEAFVDIDPRKVGHRIGGAEVIWPGALPAPGRCFVLGWVASRGAREDIERELGKRGFRRGIDYLPCA